MLLGLGFAVRGSIGFHGFEEGVSGICCCFCSVVYDAVLILWLYAGVSGLEFTILFITRDTKPNEAPSRPYCDLTMKKRGFCFHQG